MFPTNLALSVYRVSLRPTLHGTIASITTREQLIGFKECYISLLESS
jgi:hypothetical protein